MPSAARTMPGPKGLPLAAVVCGPRQEARNAAAEAATRGRMTVRVMTEKALDNCVGAVVYAKITVLGSGGRCPTDAWVAGTFPVG